MTLAGKLDQIVVRAGQLAATLPTETGRQAEIIGSISALHTELGGALVEIELLLQRIADRSPIEPPQFCDCGAADPDADPDDPCTCAESCVECGARQGRNGVTSHEPDCVWLIARDLLRRHA